MSLVATAVATHTAPAAAPLATVIPLVTARDRSLAALRRSRPAAVSHDRAFHACGCGQTFTAPVTTDVSCPGCGTGQTW